MGQKTIALYLKKISKSREISLFLILMLIGLILSFCTPIFLTTENLLNIIKQVTLVAIVAAGQTFIITSGGIDLSVGSIVGLSSIIMSLLISRGMPVALAIVMCLLFGTLLGAVNGLLITKLKLPPFIITLAMQSIARGFINVITEGYPIMIDSPFIMKIGQGSWGVVPIMALFLPLVLLITHWIYSYTVFGNRVKAIGGNETATRLSGININRTKVAIYALSGLCCGLAGLIVTGRLNSGNPNAGLNYDMDSIAAVIVGGTALAGGSGTVMGTMLGAILMGVIRNGLVLMNVNMYWQTVAAGTIILLVCALDSMSKRKE